MAKGDGLFKGGVIGAIIGAVAGILFAPKSGKETREDIKEAANKAAREAEKRLKLVHEDLTSHKQRFDEQAKKIKGQARVEWDDLAKRADIAKTKLGELLSAVRDGGADDTLVQKAIDEAEEVSGKLKDKLQSK